MSESIRTYQKLLHEYIDTLAARDRQIKHLLENGEGLREALDIDSIVTRVVRAVAELPDRTSPEDQPHMMLVAGDELEDILRAALSRGRAGGA